MSLSPLVSLGCLASATPHTKPSSSLITKVCSKTSNVGLCYQILNPGGHPAGDNLVDLARAMLKPTRVIFTTTYETIDVLLNCEKNETLRELYRSCSDDYSDALKNLSTWTNYLNSGKYSFLPVTSVSVFIQPLDCDQNFAKPSLFSEPAQLKEASQNLQDIGSIMLVISNILSGDNS